MKHKTKTKQKRGQAAMTAVLFLLFVLLSVLGAVSNFALKEARGAELGFRSRTAFFVAEAGIEDAVYRLKRRKNVASSFSIFLNGSSSTTTVSDILGEKEVKSTGEFLKSFRSLRSRLLSGEGAEFFYGVQVGAGGLSMDNNAIVNGNIYSNGPIDGENGTKILGNAVALGKIEDMTIGDSTSGVARAPSFDDTIVHGSLCPNQYCIVENPAPENFPISGEQITSFKSDASSGGTISGNCGDSGSSLCKINDNDTLFLGPKKIAGNLVLTKKQTLVLTGTLYFTGYIDVDSSGGATIKCDTSFGSQSCVLLTDSWIHIKNNSSFAGSGSSSSYIMVLTTLSDCNGSGSPSGCTHHNAGIDLHNNATGAIFYASSSMAHLHNGVNVTQLVANKLELENNAIVNYESGLSNVNFSSGPSGGWTITEWKEVIQ